MLGDKRIVVQLERSLLATRELENANRGLDKNDTKETKRAPAVEAVAAAVAAAEMP